MDNIILLDLDGVLITTPNWKPDKMHEDGYSDFNPICVDNLNRLLKQTKFDIVLSSTSRRGVEIDQMNEYFKARGLIKPIVAYVPLYEGKLSRLQEIELFLKEHEPMNYFIIDDDKSLLGGSDEIQSSWIQTYPILVL